MYSYSCVLATQFLHHYLWWMRFFVGFVIYFLVHLPTMLACWVNNDTQNKQDVADDTLKSTQESARSRNCYSEKANPLSHFWSLWSASEFYMKHHMLRLWIWWYANRKKPSESSSAINNGRFCGISWDTIVDGPTRVRC